MSDSGKSESGKLLGALLDVAELMLAEDGQFYPFGGYLDADGEIAKVALQSSDPSEAMASRVQQLADMFVTLAAQGKFVACGLASNVVARKADGSGVDAIQVELEHRDGYGATVFYEYALTEGVVEFGEAYSQRRQSRFFAPR